ncbi:MAG: hypothetical protein V3V97_16710 [Hyphomicrobiaceae bacterium]
MNFAQQSIRDAFLIKRAVERDRRTVEQRKLAIDIEGLGCNGPSGCLRIDDRLKRLRQELGTLREQAGLLRGFVSVWQVRAN